VRIALSGAHAVGKTSLLAELRRQLTSYEAVDEPYSELLDQGHEFADPPSVDAHAARRAGRGCALRILAVLRRDS
jgi:hypothetical protein